MFLYDAIDDGVAVNKITVLGKISRCFLSKNDSIDVNEKLPIVIEARIYFQICYLDCQNKGKIIIVYYISFYQVTKIVSLIFLI